MLNHIRWKVAAPLLSVVVKHVLAYKVALLKNILELQILEHI